GEASGEAYSALGIVKMFYEFDWPGVDGNFQNALKWAPGFVDANHFYGHYLEAMGRKDESIDRFKNAIKIEPSTLILRVELANVYYHGREFEKAIEQCQNVIAEHTNSAWSYAILAAAKLQLQKPGDAFDWIQKARGLTANGPGNPQGRFPNDPIAD